MHASTTVALTALFTLSASPAARGAGDVTTQLTHVGSVGNPVSPFSVISADGTIVVFASGDDTLVPGDTNGFPDIFVYERATGAITRANVSTSGAQANHYSSNPVASADGRYIAFESYASNLDADPNGNDLDIFVRDRQAGTTTLISRDSAGGGANGSSYWPTISRDGQRIAFVSGASDLVAGDVNNDYDAFLFDAATGVTTLLSTTTAGTQGDQGIYSVLLSGDGSKAFLASSSTNFPDAADPNFAIGTFRKDLVTGVLERVDGDDAGLFPYESYPAACSDDGSILLFSTPDGLRPEDDNSYFWDAYRRDFGAGTLEVVSVTADGTTPSSASFADGMSGDGRFIVWQSYFDGFTPGDTNGITDVFVTDRAHGTTLRESVGTFDEEFGGGNIYAACFVSGGSGHVVPDDGSALVFEYWADANTGNAFLRERDLVPAGSVNYGSGWPGRNGVIPTMTASATPWRGTEFSIDLTNSSKLYTIGFVFVGLTRDSIPTSLGGTLLLDPLLLIAAPLTPYGGSLLAESPIDWWASGLIVDLQTLELDPWASKGVSFTDGLELTFGDG